MRPTQEDRGVLLFLSRSGNKLLLALCSFSDKDGNTNAGVRFLVESEAETEAAIPAAAATIGVFVSGSTATVEEGEEEDATAVDLVTK